MNNDDWNKAVAFHGHECPGLAIGFKAVEAARLRLGLASSEDEEIVCVTENDACGVDAVQALLSCTFGKGNLIFRATGKQAFSFYDRKNDDSLRVYLKAARPDGIERPEWMRTLLESPVEELFTFSKPTFSLPERARLFSSIPCAVCGEKAPEHRMRLQGGAAVCLDCFKDYGRGF